MSKLPYIPIYPGDWERDANCLKSYAEFALFKLTIKLNDAKNKGIYIADFDTLSTLFKCDLAIAERSIKDLKVTDTLDIEYLENGFVEIKSRRILREKAISEIRAAAGKTGGKAFSKKLNKQTTSKTKAKPKQITENEDESDIENEDDFKGEKKYARDEILEKSVLKYFGFTEQINQDKASLVFQFCTALFNANKIEHFRIQFKNYCEYKNVNGYKHKIHNFLGTQSELFVDGAWDDENWEQKIKDLKSSPKKFDENNVIFPNVWEQNFYLKLSTAAKRVEYVSHLKEKIGGSLIMVGVNNSPQWKYPETPKTAPGYILGGIGSIGKEKAS